MGKRYSAVICGVVIGMLSSSASAQEASGGARTHDGFYFQGALGGGYLRSSASSSGTDVSIYGGGPTGSLWFGGTPAAGLVVGGGLVGAGAVGPSVQWSYGGQTGTATSNTDSQLNLSMVGPFIDYYMNPHEGLHFQAMLALAVLSAQSGTSSSSDNPVGVGVVGGVGYEWWVGDQWSIGILGRLGFASTSKNDQSWTSLAPGLLASFTYH